MCRLSDISWKSLLQYAQLFRVFQSFFGGVGVVQGETMAMLEEREDEELLALFPVMELFRLFGVCTIWW
jgi:hypothetical protein